MPETGSPVLLRRDAFADLPALPATAGFAARPIAAESAFVLRARGAAVAAASSAFGLVLPEPVGATAEAAGRAALCLGPDEWLLIAPPEAAAEIVPAFAALTAPLSLVEIGDRDAALELTGPLVAEALAAEIPVDLDLAAFPVGRATRTLFGKAGVMLWRRGAERFRLAFGRSFAGYVTGRLAVAVGHAQARADDRG
ncbi:sarcosine oxidase subunit gamma [Siculibacillus lacustris]|uniref:Sarcosine oxidase subunit gamma n=1 Tax=Siculibacillus lacustris TaxID=1549641 RepID=A0A4Q9VHT7_9HYPH|nr:sarcosine oxidase subunit gamma family protein [Siculibacillus lacustris]TBW34610.1 sarcosine oxidase subunit gamma [Siculibacillus lacustris]